MFGYIIVNKPEMKFKEYDIYHAYYCGLCRSLKRKYGMTGQMSLSYDMTFLTLLLTGLYEPKETYHLGRCAAHPFSKHPAVENVFTEYAADMNVLLTYHKCEDDWKDERRLFRHAYGIMLNSKCKKHSPYPQKAKRIAKLLQRLSENEKEGVGDIDQMAGIFGEIMAEIFAYQQDEWEQTLRKCGFYLGKFIYLLDAYEDVEEDIRKNTYNPLKEKYRGEDFESSAGRLLTMMIAECSKCFEQLPILKNVEILRNILYSGVWYRYEMVREKRRQKTKQEIEIDE